MSDPRTPAQLGGVNVDTIPLWPLLAGGACACGNCESPGKHPAAHMYPQPGAGYGIHCGERNNVFVIDCDVKPDANGLEEFGRLCRERGGHELPNTLVVRTGSGGFHFFFRWPGKRIKNSRSKLAKAVDVKGDGGWVVGPGSPHANGGTYAVVNDAPVLEAPPWLLAWQGLYHGEQPDGGGPTPPVHIPWVDPESDEGKRRINAYVLECKGLEGEFPSSVAGNRGHDRLFAIARRGTAYWQIPIDLCALIVWEHFNPRCEPPWQWHDIHRKVNEAVRTLVEPSIGPPPMHWGAQLSAMAALGGELPAEPVDRPRDKDPTHVYTLDASRSVVAGKPTKCAFSDIVFRLVNHPSWSGVLYFDEFAHCIRAVNPPMRLDAETSEEGLSDNDISRFSVWFEAVQGFAVARERLIEAVQLAAQSIKVHPVREYLYALPKTPTTILDDLAGKLWGGSKLESDLVRKFLVGAVRRILRPGTQMDTMLVLQGHQGAKKTQFVRTLFGWDWSSQSLSDITTKDASQGLQGVWGQEIGELDKFLRVDPMTAKDFVSRTDERYRPPFGRAFIRVPRQVVFVGTTNLKSMLRDPTGERRYWICRIPDNVVLDLEWVKAHRDEIWSAALQLAIAGTPHWIDEGTAMAMELRTSQEQHAERDPWEEILRDYLRGKTWVATRDLYRWAISHGETGWEGRFGVREQNRINTACQRIGCDPEIVGGSKGWKVPEPLASEAPSKPSVETPKLALLSLVTEKKKPA